MESLELLRFDRLGATHFISTRGGGVSKGPYESLNIGLHVGDEREAVLENRKRLAQAVGMRTEQLTYMRQVHGGTVARVREDDVGHGAETRETAPEADALVTDVPGACLMVLVADCVPVALHDPEGGAVAIIHGGWKSTAAGILTKTVRAMEQEFGSKPEDIVAGLGPAIGPCHYEVGPEVRERFPDFTVGSAIDVRAANESQLREAGVRDEHIESIDICTYEDERFFSARQDGGTTGRFAAGIALP